MWQNTAGLLARRRARYLDEIEMWRTNSDIVGVVQEDVDEVINHLRQFSISKQPRAPGIAAHDHRMAA